MYKSLILSILFLWEFIIASANEDDAEKEKTSISNPNMGDGPIDYALSEPHPNEVKVFDSFNENGCEVIQERTNVADNSSYVCMRCKIIVSQTTIQAESLSREAFGDDPRSELFMNRFRLETETRYFCPDLEVSTCDIKPVFVIKKPRLNGHVPETLEIIEGFEIAIDAVNGNASKIFLEIDIDHKSYEALEYPDIVVEYIPSYTFEPNSLYRLSLVTLPKFQLTGLDSWDGLHMFKTPALPSQDRLDTLEDEEIGHWPTKVLRCSDRVWCLRGSDCNMEIYSSTRGVLRSFVIAVTICFLILWFFVVLVSLARSRVRKLSRLHGDTEYLYEEDDDFFDDYDTMPKRTNDTEMLDLSQQQKSQLAPSATETSVHFKHRENTSCDPSKMSPTSNADFQSALIEVNSGGALYSYPNPDNSAEDFVANMSIKFATSNID